MNFISAPARFCFARRRSGQLRVPLFCWIVLVWLPVAAVGQVWRSKPADQWTEQDAKQVLTASPWVKVVSAGLARRESEDELRAGGQMGQPTGVGYQGVDPKGSGPKIPTNIFTPDKNGPSPRSLVRPITLKLVWESALPVRLAELKSREVEPPTLDSDGYQLAVYGIPGGDFKQDPKKLGDPLKDMAVLKRDGKKDVKPLRVEAFPREDGVVVVYVFPLSAEISERDTLVRFQAHIGRVVVDHAFDLTQMKFLGKLEL